MRTTVLFWLGRSAVSCKCYYPSILRLVSADSRGNATGCTVYPSIKPPNIPAPVLATEIHYEKGSMWVIRRQHEEYLTSSYLKVFVLM